jgi:hypothetical protein
LSFCGKKIAGDAVPGIVIALKRNGAYADNIQVQQLGLSELFENGENRCVETSLKASATIV